MPQRILVTGASGQIGREVLAQLSAAGVPVRALSRNPRAAGLPDSVDIVGGDLSAPETLDAALDDVPSRRLPERRHAPSASGRSITPPTSRKRSQRHPPGRPGNIANASVYSVMHEIAVGHRAECPEIDDALDMVRDMCDRAEDLLVKGDVEPAMDLLISGLEAARTSLTPTNWWRAVDAVRTSPIHLRLLEDPYIAAAYRKADGYAGDARTLDFVYRLRQAPANTSALGCRLLGISTDVPIAAAVRARSRHIADLVTRRLVRRPTSTVVSIACGHMRELRWIEPEVLAGAHIVGMDQDETSLACAGDTHPCLTTIRNSVRRVLVDPSVVPEADIIYSAGLFDYLDGRTAILLVERLGSRLRTGGVLVVVNLTATNAEIAFMEAVMDWWMIYRDEEDLRRLVPENSSFDCRTYSLAGQRLACLELTRPVA